MIYNTSNKIEKEKYLKRAIELAEEGCIVNLTKKQPIRTLKQNSYLHLILGWFALNTGYTTIEAKELFKRLNKDVFEYVKTNIKFYRSSSDLDKTELTKCIEKFRNWSANNGGVYLPSPDEKGFLNEINKQVQNKREFL